MGPRWCSYFRWRAALGAQELMHAGLLLHDGGPDTASAEARTVAGELPASRPHLRPRVALLFDYENLWASNLQPHAEGWNYWHLLLSYYGALRALAVDVDIVHPARDLSPYPLVLAPALYLVDEVLADHLGDYLRSGGRLLLGPRSGAKTPSNLAQQPAPGPLAALSGVRVDRVDALRPGLGGDLALASGGSGRYHTWADLLTPLSAEVIASYQPTAYRGAAAITRNPVGSGSCFTLGAWATTPATSRCTRDCSRRPELPGRCFPTGSGRRRGTATGWS